MNSDFKQNNISFPNRSLFLSHFLKQTTRKKKKCSFYILEGFPGGMVVKNPPANEGDAGDLGLIIGLGRSP